MSTETDTRTHKVAKDDTLKSLALRYYGNAEKWPVIQRANKLQSEDIFVGEELIIPDVTLPPPAPAPEHRFVPMSPRERAAGHRNPDKPTSPLKVIAWVIATPILAFAAFVIINMISEGLSDTQYNASKMGLSLRECREGVRIMGGTDSQARELCDKRVPK